jgi:hypothetical protein
MLDQHLKIVRSKPSSLFCPEVAVKEKVVLWQRQLLAMLKTFFFVPIEEAR